MAAPVRRPPGSSAYPLFLALALVALSLWRVNSGLVEHQFSAQSGGDNAATSLAPFDPQADSHSHLRAGSLDDLAFGSWGGIPVTAENEVRRKATVALMVYATADGIRR
jgi:hypothetical protein